MADMKDKKLNDNEMEQVSGGDVLDVLETAGKGLFFGGSRVLCDLTRCGRILMRFLIG